MKKIISFILMITLILSFSCIAFATKSPTINGILVPPIKEAYLRVMNEDGQVVKYLSTDDIVCDEVINIRKYFSIENLIYLFVFDSSYELNEGEYIEFPIYFNGDEELELKAVVETEESEYDLDIIRDEEAEDIWMLHISQYGTIIITAQLP